MGRYGAGVIETDKGNLIDAVFIGDGSTLIGSTDVGAGGFAGLIVQPIDEQCEIGKLVDTKEIESYQGWDGVDYVMLFDNTYSVDVVIQALEQIKDKLDVQAAADLITLHLELVIAERMIEAGDVEDHLEQEVKRDSIKEETDDREKEMPIV